MIMETNSTLPPWRLLAPHDIKDVSVFAGGEVVGGQQKRKMSFEISPVESRVLTDEDEEEGGTISFLPSHFFL